MTILILKILQAKVRTINMKQHEFFYRDIDRILRIIYRDLAFEHYKPSFNLSIEKGIRNEFNLADEMFQNNIIGKYLQVYPDNYNREDLEIILNNLVDILLERYKESNAIYLIFFISNEIFQQDTKNVFVDFNDLLEWDGYSNKLDTKLFLASYLLQRNMSLNAFSNSVLAHNNKRLYDIMRRNGISENHMHLKASGYTEEINWHSFVQKDLSDIDRYTDFIRSSGIFKDVVKTKEKKNALLQFLLKFKVIRLILSYELRENDKVLIQKFRQNIDRILLSDDVINTLSTIGLYQELRNFESFEKTRQASERKKAGNYRENEDVTSFALAEGEFLHSMLSKIYRKSENSYFVLYLFNLYVAGMTTFKFQFIQDNLGMGFSKFKEKEDNKSHFVDNDDIIVRSVFHKYYREKYVQKIEIRIGPKNSAADYIKLIESLEKYNHQEFQAAKNEFEGLGIEIRKIRYGIIVHFIKNLKTPNGSFVTDLSNKRQDLRKKAEDLLEAIRILEQGKRNKLVAIDTANYEQDNRPEIFGPFYRKIRGESHYTKAIGATFHVGEEFPTLANGLRAIDEVLTFLDYRANDRLGHALALGIDVDHYFKVKRSNVLCSLGDYLDDIVWLYTIISEGSCDPSLLLYLRSEFDRYKFHLFEGTIAPKNTPSFEDYTDAYYLRGDCPDTLFELKNLSYEHLIYHDYKFNLSHKRHKQSFLNEKARQLFLRYSFDSNYRERAESSFQVKINDKYIECVKVAQRMLKLKILDLNVFIEANPTSNKKISIMTRYSQIPALTISGPSLLGQEDSIKLPVSINTDDSSIFQTNLVNEYSLVAASLLKEGYAEEDVYAYIEELAIASNIHSFIE